MTSLLVWKTKGMDYQTMFDRVQEALDIVGMQDFKEREPARLSGGQSSVAIAGVVVFTS